MQERSIPYEEIVLQRWTAACQAIIPGADFRVTDEPWDTFGSPRRVISMLLAVFGEELAEVYEEWPTTWWDAFKERFYPDWAWHRWPGNYTTITLTAKAVYPQLAAPAHQPQIRLLRMTELATWTALEADEVARDRGR